MTDSGLNPQFERDLDAALRRAPDVVVPKHFSQRALASQPGPTSAPAAAARSSRWIFPALALAAAATLAALGIAAVDVGWAQALTQPAALVTILGIESALSLAWVWRVMRAAR